jgi:hypothetical protein
VTYSDNKSRISGVFATLVVMVGLAASILFYLMWLFADW